ncbi:hypothetical protein CSV86_013775 [Pseudomonas putida CSV86]|uniref:Toxin VasX N-terminal region domain-containing protein n=1 Tax=Pseudomonas bharatica CSV86 TaxID=1005395 RepID=A0A7K4EFN4_9PSED|nr:toxin VasX [Pseudomonas bharatica]NNJ16210.1 hypothetical protein [Pseudomonas bharatica CSV86]
MSNLEKTFELCELMRTWLQGQVQGSATTCTRTFSFLPLRYGAVGGSASQKGQLPFLPPHLSRPTKVGRLSESAYALRPLREGFLYVLIKRKEAAYAWHSQYRVSAIGVLDFIDPDRPWANRLRPLAQAQ